MNRFAFLIALATPLVGGALSLACSSSDDSSASVGDAGASDATSGDGSFDGASDARQDAAPDSASDSGIVGNCSPVKGSCDLVLQDCPQGQECAIALADGGYHSQCRPTQASEHIPKGATCCPSTSGNNPCLPGLECIGAACTDGGTPTARCMPHCCPGEDFICGQSPEGFPGHCDISISSSDSPPVPLFNGCTYSSSCEPLGVVPCPSGFSCIVQDPQGTAKCIETFNPDGGKGLAEGNPCTFTNSCADGLMCLTPADAGARCIMMCLVPGSSPPFDAGALTGGPFHGGCSQGKTCFGAPNIFPSWLGVCQ